MNQTVRWISLLLIVFLLAGCSSRQVWTGVGVGAAAAAGVAAVYYVRGDLEADLKEHIEESHSAVLKVMNDRGYTVTEETVGTETGTVKAKIPAVADEKERNLTIKLERKTEELTHISIRVGVFGDEELSRAILGDIEEELF